MKTLVAALLFAGFAMYSPQLQTNFIMTKQVSVTHLVFPTGEATGFFVRGKSGKTVLLTARHVCEHVPEYADVLYVYNDICTLRGDFSKQKPLSLAKSAGPFEEEWIVGYPMDFGLTITHGYSQLKAIVYNGIQVISTTSVLPGNSGSPVLNRYGHIIGVVSTLNNGRTGYIPLEDVKNFLDTL